MWHHYQMLYSTFWVRKQMYAYEKGKCIKTKEQLDAERKEADAKYKANREKYKAEDDAFKKEIEAAREEDIKAGRVED